MGVYLTLCSQKEILKSNTLTPKSTSTLTMTTAVLTMDKRMARYYTVIIAWVCIYFFHTAKVSCSYEYMSLICSA